MSDTPRTDYEAEHDGLVPAVVKADFARRLERELTQLQQVAAELASGNLAGLKLAEQFSQVVKEHGGNMTECYCIPERPNDYCGWCLVKSVKEICDKNKTTYKNLPASVKGK